MRSDRKWQRARIGWSGSIIRPRVAHDHDPRALLPRDGVSDTAASDVGGAPPARATASRRWLKVVALALLLATAALVAWKLGFFALRDPRALAAAIRRAREVPGIVPLFVATYALVATFGLPALPLTLAGGAMFGVGLGAALSWLGALLGASGAYALARLLGRDAVQGSIGKWGKRLDLLGERSGFLTILRLRLIAIVPFNLINLAAGLAGVPLRSYLAATALGIMPGTIVYTYFADSLVAGVEGAGHQAFVRVAVASVLLLLVSFAPSMARRLGARHTTRKTESP